MDADCIDYKETGFFSHTVTDYLEDKPELRPFYGHRPDMDGFAALLQNKKVTGNRETLAKVLTDQYHAISQFTTHNSPQVHQNIGLLKAPDTYTITTGHQLNIF